MNKVKSGIAKAEYIEVEENVRLHITDVGEGRAIVLIHGWPFSDDMFEYQYRDLIQNKFRVISICLRGFGKSDKPYSAYNYDIHAQDIKNILSKLDIKDAVMLGFSMGGSIAIRYISKYNSAHISKLILCGAAAPIWTQRDDFKFNMLKSDVDELIELNYQDRPKLISNFAKIFSANEKTLNEAISNWLYSIGISASSFATAECLKALRDTDLRADLAKIAIPTLIIHGKKDKICKFELAEQMQKAIKNSHIIDFENSGHSMFLEEKEKFNSEIIDFAGE
jgi:non-heme chloroperoxidase